MSIKLSRRQFLCTAVIAAGSAVAAACGATPTPIPAPTATAAPKAAATQAPAPAAKPVKVRFLAPTWATTTDRRVERQVAFRSVLDSFNQKYTGRKWTVEEVPFDGDSVALTKEIEGKRAEAIWFNRAEVRNRAMAGQLLPLDNALQGEDKKFFKWAMDAMTYAGKVVALWHNTDTPLYYYNKEKIPTPPKNWTELQEMCKSVRSKEGGKKYGFVHPFVGWLQMNSGLYVGLGGQYVDKDGAPVAFTATNKEIWRYMFNFYLGLVKDDLIPAGAVGWDQTQQMPEVYTGNIYSFAGNSNFHVRQLQPNMKAEDYAKWTAVALPIPDKGKPLYEAGGWVISAVNTTDPDVAAASAAFTIHATGAEAQTIVNKAGVWIPTRPDIIANDPLYNKDPFYQVTLKALETGYVVPLDPVYIPMTTAIVAALGKAATGKASVDQALADAEAETMREYDAIKKK